MAYNPVTNHVLIPSREPNINAVIILDGNTGDSIGALNMTGITGGLFPFNRIAVSEDGRIYTANLQTTVTKAAPVKIYTWTNESAVPTVAFSDSIQGPRIGDALAVVGSGQETYVYVSGNATPGPVHIFKRSGDSLLIRKSFVPTGWAAGVLGFGPLTNGLGTMWLNTSGKPAIKYDTTGSPIDTITTGIVSSGASTAHYFEYGGRKFVAMYSGNTTPSVFRIVDVTTSGSLNNFVVAITAPLGTSTNTNGTGEVIYSPADSSLYVFATNNSVGKYSVPLSTPGVTFNSRLPYIPNAGENDTVYFNLLTMKSIGSAQLAYYGFKTTGSDQGGVDSALATLTQFSGRVYQSIIPGSVNRDGRRIAFSANVTDAAGAKATVSVPGYFAGITKLGFIGGPRDIDTAGVMLYSGYGIRIKGVCVFEDSVIAAPTSRMDIALQDSLGGMDVIDFTVPFPIRVIRGNSYTMEGVMSHYNSRIQLASPINGKNIVATDNGPAQLPAPKLITIRDLAFDRQGEQLENSLIQLNNVRLTPGSLAWPGAAGAGTNLTITDNGVDSITMRIPAKTNLNGFVPPQTFSVVGVAGQFSSGSKKIGYQLIPRDPNDILIAPSLPLNFEAGNVDYTFTNFSGATATRIPNPQKNGLDTSNFVVKMVKGAGDPWAGSYLSLDKPIDFKGTKLFKVKVFMPKVGAKLLLKVENQTNGAINMEKDAIATVANAWQELYYDFSGIDTSKQYQKVVLICDLGTVGDGSANFTYLIDDIQQYVAPITRKIVGLKNSKMTVGITNVGHIGALNDYQDTLGFMFNSINTLYEGSLIMGNAKNRVPNAARFNAAPSWNPGFRHRSPIMITKDGSTTETMATFDDSTYANPLGIIINQHTAIDTAAGKEGYLLLGYDVINKSGATINNFLIGSFFDFDLTAAGDVDRGGILKDSTNTIPGVNGGVPFKINLAYMYNGTTFVGLVPLTQTVFAGGRIAIGPNEVYGGKMVDSNKYQYISTFRATNTFTDGGAANDLSIFGSVGPYTIAANDTTHGAFGLVVGSSLIELLNNARAAQKAAVQEYGITLQILTGVEGEKSNLPTSYALDQNYPNPFNPSTTIRFALPSNSLTKLVVYDVLGREVRTLINNNTEAGYHEIVWNGRNNLGSQVASGMYIYRIESGSFISTKKMMLLK